MGGRHIGGEPVKDRFHLAMLHSPIGMAIIGADGGFVEVNEALCRILDRTADDLLACTWQQLTHPDDLASDSALVEDLVQGRRDSYHLRKRYLHPDGTVVHGDLAVVALRDHGGQVEFFIAQVVDVTALVTLQQQYQLIAENVTDVVSLGDNEGMIRWLSPSVTTALGWTPDSLIGRPFRELVHPDDLPTVAAVQAALLAGQAQELEIRLRTAQDTYRWINIRIRPYYDQNGEVAGRVAGWWDVHERHEALERAAQAQERYRAALDAEIDAHLFLESVRSPDGDICDFTCVDANTAAGEYLQKPADAVIGRRLLDLFPGHRTSGLFDIYAGAVETGEPLVLEAITLASQVQGATRSFDIHGVKVGDGLSVVWRDVSQRAEAAQRLADSERRFRLLADNSADTVLLASEGIMRWLSPSLRTLLGYEPQEWVGHRFEEFTHPEDVALAQERRKEISAGQRRYTRLRMRHKNGSYRWIDINAGPVRDDDVQPMGIVATLRDADLLGSVEQALAESEAEALALANKYEQARDDALAANLAKTSFLSRMSHELRTPLNAVLGFAQLLAMDPLTEDQREAVSQIRTGGRHLLDLINEILDISRIEAGRLSLSIEPVLVADALTEALDLVRPLADAAGVTLPLGRADSCEEWVRADRQRMIQILINLLSNAIKYNVAGGSVDIACQAEGGGAVRIAVTDTGRGISPENQALLFHAFERLGADALGIEGTGVGLTLSRGLANAMHGTIEAESEVGRGSTFTLVLPRSQAAGEEPVVDRASPVLLATGRPVRVLYIEDNLANARLVSRICELRDNAVLESAASGHQGLELALRTVPDLILLDLHLPDMHGEEVLRQLRQDDRTHDVPIVVLTADATKAARAAARSAGADGFIAKPIEVSEVLRWIDDPARPGGFA